jgi:spermidine synthase
VGLRDWLRRRGTPRLVRRGELIDLRFESGVTKSRMRADAPDELVVDYTRTMLGALVLHPAPRRIGMVGLGGGSQAKFCLRHLPEARIEAFEIDPRVVAMRDDFHIPDDARLQVIEGDAAQWLPRRRAAYDLLLIDGYDTTGIPAALSTQAFVDACRDALDLRGVLATNLFSADHAEHFARLRKAFGDNVLLLDEPRQSNRVGFAWREGVQTDAVDVQAALAVLDLVARTQLASAFARVHEALCGGVQSAL